jgi:hypothetical protein
MKHNLSGTLYQTNPEQVQNLLDTWIGDTHHRSRLFGDTWELQNDDFSLLVESADQTSQNFIIDLRFRKSMPDIKGWMDQMVKALVAADILFLVDYYEVDENDEQIGDDVSYSHPEFDQRYTPPKPGE